MLTKLKICNFKRFGDVDIELGDPVIFIGPNNSGKTSALQAIALWVTGLKKWNEKRRGKTAPEKRPGVTINRRDLVAAPVPDANLLWRDLHVRGAKPTNGKPETKNIRIDILIEGISEGRQWTCGLEFDYANEESFYCRPRRLSEADNPDRMDVPDEAGKVQVAYLPPMSGLSANEIRLDPGAINVRIGEGRTAEVLRNLCYRISKERPGSWGKLTAHIRALFGSDLDLPEYVAERGEIRMGYKERNTHLDLSSSGRGLQQTLLVLSYMYANPLAVLLIDEPDAHLEILRQRQIYQLLVDVARENGNQIIAASHSEILLNEAADRDVVIAFVGKPHRVDDRGSQVQKALRDIGFEHYYQAEQTGWVLYLEGSSDLATLRTFAERLEYGKAVSALERPFVHYVGNQPSEAKKHFYGLREAVPHLKGVAIFDKMNEDASKDLGPKTEVWERREIENYLCYPEVLLAYAESTAKQEAAGPLFAPGEASRRAQVMRDSIEEVERALSTLGKSSPWDAKTKVSDEFLTPVFEKYFKKLTLPNVMAKKNFHELALFVPKEKLSGEVKQKLNTIVDVAESATPVS